MSFRRKLIAGNWKMNKTSAEAKSFVRDLLDLMGKPDDVEVLLCPPYTALTACQEALENSTELVLGAQNLHFEVSGAFTGEISAVMLRDLFCRYVIIGHSERRQLFGETDEIVNKKAVAAMASRLRPIICVGETLQEREAGKTLQVIEKQCREGFKGFTAEQWSNVVVAYEPVWAIGTGKTATSAQAQEVHAAIRKLIAALAGETVAEKVRILYGGSVKPDNAKELMFQEDIDGALVGGASLEVEPFVKIIKATAEEEDEEKKKA